jgi:hypothetical protein
MRWSEFVSSYPKQWVITEAREFETEYDRRFGRDWYPVSAHAHAEAGLTAYIEITRSRPGDSILLVDTAVPGGINEAAACTNCGKVGLQRKYYGLAREPFCEACYHKAKSEPQYQVVSYCRQCGSEIYQVWIDRGIATAELCPSCLERYGRTD